jgi:hypothetical protein
LLFLRPSERAAGNDEILGVGMADVIFVVLTVALFAIFGLVVKAVERL